MWKMVREQKLAVEIIYYFSKFIKYIIMNVKILSYIQNCALNLIEILNVSITHAKQLHKCFWKMYVRKFKSDDTVGV